MMGTSDDGTDQDSIVSNTSTIDRKNTYPALPQRPVSSLRSLFENIPALATPTNAPTPKPLPAHEAAHAITRASLDIPRPSSPWSSSEDSTNTQRLGTPVPPVPRPRRPNSRLLHRPLSTNALIEPRSPPQMKIDSPKSPPKSSDAISARTVGQHWLVRTFPADIVGPDSSQMAPVPPKRVSRIPTTDVQLSIAGCKSISEEPGQSPRVFEGRPIPDTAKSFPPPVNRTDKPKLPPKQTAISNKVSLEPLASPAIERVSPFSTPPSSDESVGQGSPAWKTPSRNQIPDLEPITARSIYTQLPSRSWSVQGTHQHDRTFLAPSARPPDPRNFGFTPMANLPNVISGDRPILPPRKGHSQRIAAVQTSNELREEPDRASQGPARHVWTTDSTRQSHTSTFTPGSLPPPKRAPISKISSTTNYQKESLTPKVNPPSEPSLRPGHGVTANGEAEPAGNTSLASEYPDASITSRRPPYCGRGVQEIDTGYDFRHMDICGPYVAAAGHLTRAWDSASGNMALSLGHVERDIRVTSLAFKPGAKASEEGLRLWLGTNYGDIQEVDILTQSIIQTKTRAHERREVLRIFRHQNSMWTLDDGGKLCVWPGGETGLPDLQCSPLTHRVPKGHTFSIKIQDTLWLATGKEIRIFRPSASEAAFSLLHDPLKQQNVGAVTAGAIISSQLDRVYFGHADGKVTIYSTLNVTCVGVICVSVYKISTLAGAGFHIWAGYNTGMIYVYDTRTQPWTTKKEWTAHSGPVLNIVTDRGSLWKDGVLRVVSLGTDNVLRLWDGTLEDDWLGDDLQDRDIEYCSFREITALVVTWNAGAATPSHIRHDESDPQFFQNMLQSGIPPDLLVFGFQELVDLEDKKLTAKNLFKGNKKRDPLDQEHIGSQYRTWRDYLVRCVEDSMPSEEPYHLLHTASMVGLFSCVFIKASQRRQIRDVNAAELKRGMGGLHGNKGALILRFVLDDSSLCLVNCHLAAGQSQTANRNNDLTAILESAILAPDGDSSVRSDTYVGGGDGSMVLDSEICILNGDLNYRIDTMGRDAVLKAVNANNFSKLLERDQLLVSRRRNPVFCIRAFKEMPINFAPTYKYDVGTDRYDTSEKRRAPAWCDRILSRGPGKIKQINYQRHELRVSDHRPVSGVFKIRIKKISPDKRATVWRESQQRFAKAKDKLSIDSKIEYLRDVLGVPPTEAKRLV